MKKILISLLAVMLLAGCGANKEEATDAVSGESQVESQKASSISTESFGVDEKELGEWIEVEEVSSSDDSRESQDDSKEASSESSQDSGRETTQESTQKSSQETTQESGETEDESSETFIYMDPNEFV